MGVRNVHERFIPAPAPQVGALIDGLGSRSDRLWPGDRWPAIRLDRAVSVGARGGHGPIRYAVELYVPGRTVLFRFSRPRGFLGTHAFQVEDAEGGAVLRHELEMRVAGSARLSWPLVFRPLHDALIEDALDRASAEFGHPAPPRRWSIRVRLLCALLRRQRRRSAAKGDRPAWPDHGPVEPHGCERCWPPDATAAWEARSGLRKEAELVDESHYHVMVLSCPSCRQNFLSVFTEMVDWADGEDPQYWTVVPIEAGELAILTAATRQPGEADLEALAVDRRSLWRDFQKGASAPTVGWTRGLRIGPHD